ncbi:hypothetical protein Ocin01_16635 [Orchesella cincta]|uniref:Uncharacterized protein n=1 Tax=Orchesella cincta TaxID=48709 RepID=A0A1D2MAM5_ORCCI|nr:hypothetical protein Ocin01_16635 [Orchesella cincta]
MSDLIVNQTAIHASGYSWNDIRCCYHVIERVEQPLENYDMNADSVIRYSSECHPIHNSKQRITEEFIRVYCTSTTVPLFDDVVYRELFAFPQIDKQALRRISSSKEKSQSSAIGSPPNVVIIGIDTNSRLNSRRRFKKTVDALKEMGAIEMFGYTKVGENTFPNTVAFLTGMDTKEMQPLCFLSDEDPQDDCPYVWKDFAIAGYLTATVEDVPYATGFNYLKTGFLRKPCDFYLRPFLLGVMMQPREHVWFAKCVGRYYIEELLLKYMRDMLEVGSNSSTPVFIHTWFTLMTHHCINSARFRDKFISNFLETVNKTNTLLVFMSDHGDRYEKHRWAGMKISYQPCGYTCHLSLGKSSPVGTNLSKRIHED